HAGQVQIADAEAGRRIKETGIVDIDGGIRSDHEVADIDRAGGSRGGIGYRYGAVTLVYVDGVNRLRVVAGAARGESKGAAREIQGSRRRETGGVHVSNRIQTAVIKCQRGVIHIYGRSAGECAGIDERQGIDPDGGGPGV